MIDRKRTAATTLSASWENIRQTELRKWSNIDKAVIVEKKYHK